MNTVERILGTLLSSPDPLTIDAYSGFYYAFYGSGGFSVDQSFNPITLVPYHYNPANFQLYDVTYALQVRYDVRTLNAKLGLIKDASNINILDTSYVDLSHAFPNDTITISANDFVSNMSAEQVISLGKYTTMYNDYLESVNQYFFGFSTGDTDVLSEQSITDISGGIFNASSFMSLIQPLTISGSTYYPLNGFITISNINQLLAYAVDKDVFDNRHKLIDDPVDLSAIPQNKLNMTTTDPTMVTTQKEYDPSTNISTITITDTSSNITTIAVTDYSNNTVTVTTTDANGNDETVTTSYFNTFASFADVSYSTVPRNFSIADGFLAGDLIFVPAGTTVQLEIMINPYLGSSSTMSIVDLITPDIARQLGLATPQNGVDLSSIPIQTSSIINQIISAPLLIELADLS
jgi:hypothetical protein